MPEHSVKSIPIIAYDATALKITLMRNTNISTRLRFTVDSLETIQNNKIQANG